MRILKWPDGRAVAPIFTPEEWTKIKSLLPEKVDDGPKTLFIANAQFVCMRVLGGSDTLYNRLSKSELTGDQARAISGLETAKKLLSEISSGKLLPSRAFGIADQGPTKADHAVDPANDPENFPVDYVNFKAADHANQALAHVSELLKIFEESKQSAKGNSKINEEFAELLADAYEQYIGTPTASIKESFVQVLDAIFRMVGIKISYPDKLAQKVLKNILP